MEDFETFKASREKIDPTTRKFSKRQWQKAFNAYRSSRKRLEKKRPSNAAQPARRRRSADKARSAGDGYQQNSLVNLRSEIRQNSAYSDLRVLLDVLAWVALGVVAFIVGGKLFYLTNGAVALVAILDGILSLIAVVALRSLVHVLIDIPDIALHRNLGGQAPDRDAE